jgi:peptidoglycan/LPS O-acetylase OafA/YrhL
VKLLWLQVVRGLAANLVVLQHLWEFEQRYGGTRLPIFVRYADLGVDVFFVLSGFVMAAIAGRDVGPLQFLWRRATRIYPTYWLATLLMLGAFFAVPGLVHEPIDKLSWWRSFLLVPAVPNQPIVSVGWTLVHEVYFYLVFAILLALRIPIVTGVIGWSATVIVASLLIPAELLDASPILAVATSPLTFEFMMGLIVGVLCLKWRPPNGRTLGVIGGAALALSIVLHFHFFAHDDAIFADWQMRRVAMFGPPIALILYAVISYERETRRPAPALLVALGDWSYSTYLFHFMVLSALGRAVQAVFLPAHVVWATTALLVFGFVVVNLAGAAMFLLFERPTLRSLNRLRPPTFAQPAAGSQPVVTDAAKT